jgi:hypothetical protein
MMVEFRQKSAGFWVTMPCILVEVYRLFRDTYYLHLRNRRVSQMSSYQETLLAACMFGLLLDPEDGSSTPSEAR